MDLKKAYVRVDRKTLWNVLHMYGIWASMEEGEEKYQKYGGGAFEGV